jgi:hypothetical protein
VDGRGIVVTKLKQASLVVCLFLFLFVVIGGGLHLNPGGAFLAAMTGTPLAIYLFNQSRAAKGVEHNRPPLLDGSGSPRCNVETDASRSGSLESETLVRQ